METKAHWENVYETKPADRVSWFQEHAALSLQFVQKAESRRDAKIIDVGGGASTLVDDLLRSGFKDVTVLDISDNALATARRRLGERASRVHWTEADVTTAQFPRHYFDVWHDRAVFHFLTDQDDRRKYVENVLHSVKSGGHVIIATFSLSGPTKCSGLDVVRYSPEKLHGEFGNSFDLIDHVEESHKTPSGAEQQFIYSLFEKKAI